MPEHYITAGGKRLRCGRTTGTCAAMAAAVAACACTETVTVEGWECTNKSYPRFGEDFNALKREETP